MRSIGGFPVSHVAAIVTTLPGIRPGPLKGSSTVSYMNQGAAGQPPPNNLVMAILSIFCCWPLGIAAIVFAAQVNGKWAQGDAAGAQASADKAKQFAMIAIIGGIVLTVLYILFFVVLGVASNS